MISKKVLQKFVLKFSVLSLVALATSTLLFSIWTTNKGLPYSDEAYYILLAKYPESALGSVGAPQWLAHWIWKLGPTILEFRMAGIFILVASSWILSWAALLCFRSFSVVLSRWTISAVLAAGTTAALGYGSIINFSPSYNLLNSATGYLAAAMCLLSVVSQTKFARDSLGYLLGIFLALMLISKPPAGVMMLIICPFFIFSFITNWKLRVRYTAFLFGGLCLTFVTIVVLHSSFSEAMNLQELGRKLYSDAVNSSFQATIIRYAEDFARILVLLVFQYPFTFSVIGLSFFVNRGPAGLIAGIVLPLELVLGTTLRGGWSQIDSQSHSILIIVLSTLVLSKWIWVKDGALRRMILFLLFLPLVFSFGTGNVLTTNSLYSLAPWMLVIVFFFLLQTEYRQEISFTSVAPLVLSCLLLFQFITSTSDPYHLPTSLNRQTERVQVNSLGTLNVDASTLSYINVAAEMKSRCGWLSDTAFIGAYQNPGLALVLQVKPIGSPWFTNSRQLRRVLEIVDVNLQPLVVAQWIGFGDEESPVALPDELIKFPSDYQFCGVISYPFANQTSKIWYRSNK